VEANTLKSIPGGSISIAETNPLQMYRPGLVVGVLDEPVGGSFLLTIQRSEVEFVNGAAVIDGLVLFDQWVIDITLYCLRTGSEE
jgi:hypothetical protein